MSDHHFDKHRVPALLLSAVLVVGSLTIVHNFQAISELTDFSFADNGFQAELIRDLNTNRDIQVAQAGGFGDIFNEMAVWWYETVCNIIQVCKN